MDSDPFVFIIGEASAGVVNGVPNLRTPVLTLSLSPNDHICRFCVEPCRFKRKLVISSKAFALKHHSKCFFLESSSVISIMVSAS